MNFMNYILGFFMVFFAANGCEEQFNFSSIDYEAASRGVYHHVRVEGNTLISEYARDGSDRITKELTASQVNELNRLAQTFVATTADDIENPSESADRDAGVPVKVLVVGDTYSRSASFDRGNPPARLAPLVGRLLLLAQAP
tara:strand:+ start:16550 stop:16975 length:426 start_codon:yes stop_codon:yes gene_type:complete